MPGAIDGVTVATKDVESLSLNKTTTSVAKRDPMKNMIWLLVATVRYCAVTVMRAPPAMSTDVGKTERMLGKGAA